MNEEQFCEKMSSAILSQASDRMNEVIENAREFLDRIIIDFGLSPNRINPFDITLGMRPHLKSRTGVHIMNDGQNNISVAPTKEALLPQLLKNARSCDFESPLVPAIKLIRQLSSENTCGSRKIPAD